MQTAFKTYLITLLLLAGWNNLAMAQGYAGQTDSLRQLLSTPLLPEELGKAYYDLCANLYYQELHDSVVVYADKGIDLTKKYQLLFREALLTEQKALSLEFIDIDQSIEVYLEALEAYEKAGKSNWIDEVKFEGVGNAHTILIRMFARRGEMDKAMHHYNIIEKIVKNEQYNTRKAMYESMGFAQAFSGNYPEAIRYFKTSVALGKEAERAIGQPIKGMEENYSLIGAYFFKLEEPDSALHYLQKGRAIARDSSRSRIRGRAMVLRISGEIYLGLNELNQAKEYLSEALQAYQTIGDAAEVSRTAANLAACYLKMQRYPKAIEMAQKAYQKAVESNDLPSIQQSLNELKAIYLHTGQSEKALQTTLQLLEVNDSLQGVQNARLTEEFTKRYESREQQNQIDLQNARIAQQRTTIWAAALVVGLLLAIALLIFWVARQQRKTNQVLEQQKAQLQELDATKTRFFANISHELRTPLTLILAPLENAIKKSKNATQKEELVLAHANSEKLMTLVNEIMDLSKMESGKIKVETKAVGLQTLLRRIFYSYESLAKLRGIELVFDYQLKENTWLALDVNKFEKIINNLLSNALKYAEREDVITLSSLSNNAKQLELIVKDTGKGIAKADISYVFDRFYQSEGNLQQLQGGTGIGLALAREYARLMDGDLTVESELGKGSVFYLQLPFVKVSPIEIPIQTSSIITERAIAPTFQPQVLFADKPKILVVEDNLDMSQFLVKTLSPYYRCTTALNGREGLEKLEKERFDLITSDVMMPEMDGFTFLKKVHQRELFSHTPVIMLTARSLEADKLQGLQLGVDDYITKPFNTNELLARIDNLLANKKEREQLQQLKSQSTKSTVITLTAEQALIKKAEVLIIEQLANANFKVGDLAKKLNYSQRQLERIIKKLTGLSPLNFMKEIRLLQARQLLESRQFSTVAEVGYEVGFADPGYFAKVYLKRFGKRPSEVN